MAFCFCCGEQAPEDAPQQQQPWELVEQKQLMPELIKPAPELPEPKQELPEQEKTAKQEETPKELPEPKQELPEQEKTAKQEETPKQEQPPIRTYTVTVNRDAPETSFGLTLETTPKYMMHQVVLTTVPGGLLDGKVAPLDALVGISSLPTPDLAKLKNLMGKVTFTFRKPLEATYSVTKLAGSVLGFSEMTVSSASTGGLQITDVTGKAAEAGIKATDRIMAVNGEKKSPADLADLVKEVDARPGQETVNVLVLSYAE